MTGRDMYWLEESGIGVSTVNVQVSCGAANASSVAVAFYREINDMNPILVRLEDLGQLVCFLNEFEAGNLEVPTDTTL